MKLRVFSLELCSTPLLFAQHQQIVQLVDQHSAHFSSVSRTIREYAEVGYREEKSSALLQSVAAGATNLPFTLIAMSIIDRVGRKTLLLTGLFASGAHQDLLAGLLIGFIAFFAAMMVLQFFVVLFVYPETKGVTLEKMQERMAIS